MSGTTNPNFLAALRKLKIPIDDYQNHEKFQSLPLWVGDPLWNDFKKPRYGELDAFELGALKNVRCLAFSQPPQAPPVGATAATAFSDGTFTEEKLSKLIDDHVEKRMKFSPGKHNAVFPLFKNGDMCGSSFAFDSCRVMSARHNLFQPTEVATLSSADTVQIMFGTELVEMQIESTPNPISGALPDTDDWIILRRIDNISFRTTILVVPTNDAAIVDTRPYVTIYHYPIDLQTTINDPHTIVSSSNRLIGAHEGKLNCNDISNISGGSCGGPYVDHVSGGAYGFHIEGVNSYGGGGFKQLVRAISLIPVGLHFRSDSSLVAELKRMKVLF